MIKDMVRTICLIVALLLVACGFQALRTERSWGRVQAEDHEDALPTQQEETRQPVERTAWTFADHSNSEITLQVPVERAVVLQYHSLDMIAQLGAQDVVIAVGDDWKRNLGDFMLDVFPSIDTLPTVGTIDQWDINGIMALEPDVVIASDKSDKVQISTLRSRGVPVVVMPLYGDGAEVSGDEQYTEGCRVAIETLGRITGREERAEHLWNFCLESREIVDKALSSLSEQERVRAFIAKPNDYTCGNEKYLACQIVRAGAINVAADEIHGVGQYSLERLCQWDPDVIVVHGREQDLYDEITTDLSYRSLTAVQDERVLLVPIWTKPWGNPDPDAIALGELWLASEFYPDLISHDFVRNRAEIFYEQFYGIAFSVEQWVGDR